MSCMQSGEIAFKCPFFEVSHVCDEFGRITHAGKAASRRRASDPKYAELEKKHEVALAIADLVILHRTRTKLTQEALASRMRTSVSAISRLESGFHVPSIDTLRKLAAALGGRIKIDIVDIESPKAARRSARATGTYERT